MNYYLTAFAFVKYRLQKLIISISLHTLAFNCSCKFRNKDDLLRDAVIPLDTPKTVDDVDPADSAALRC